MIPPPLSPSLWPVRMFIDLIKKSWINLEYFAFRGLVSDFNGGGNGASGGGGNNGGNWGSGGLGKKGLTGGRWLREVVLVDVAIVGQLKIVLLR
jgi:hypothetical protein